MALDNTLIIHGNVGTPVDAREGRSGPWVFFRVGSTPSWWDGAARQWREHPTTWVTVKAFRQLAQNAADSLNVGDPVVVVGRIRTEEWTDKGGEQRRTDVIEASFIGHDLNRGTTRFARVERQAQVTEDPGETAAALAALDDATPAA